MLNESNAPSLSDIAAVTRDNSDFGGFGGGGWWAVIILFALFGGFGGNWFGGNGERSATTGDIQRGFDTQSLLNKIDGVTSQMNALGYDQLGRLDNLSSQIAANRCDNQALIQNAMMANLQSANQINSNLASYNFGIQQGIGDVKYNQASDTCSITNAINQAVQTIMQNDNANYRLLHDENVNSEMNRLKEIIADKDNEISKLALSSSQAEQNAYLVNELRPNAIPAYTVPNPWTGRGYTGCCGMNS